MSATLHEPDYDMYLPAGLVMTICPPGRPERIGLWVISEPIFVGCLPILSADRMAGRPRSMLPRAAKEDGARD